MALFLGISNAAQIFNVSLRPVSALMSSNRGILMAFKGQMQRNLDNFSFVENPFQKHKSYRPEAESTIKIWFCTDCGARDKKIRRFPRALRKRTRNGRAEIGNEYICDVMFGEPVFMTIGDSEAFEKSSSLFQGFLKFID